MGPCERRRGVCSPEISQPYYMVVGGCARLCVRVYVCVWRGHSIALKVLLTLSSPH